MRDATTLTVQSDTGSDAILPAATTNTGGLGVHGGVGGLTGLMTADMATQHFNRQKMYNVLDYGAIGDGNDANSATNRDAIQAALDEAAAAGGGKVWVPAGIYMIEGDGTPSTGGVRIQDNCALVGDGRGATIIRLIDIGDNDITGIVRTPSGIVTENVLVQDLTIDGNAPAQTGFANVICFYAGVTPGDRINRDKDIYCINVRCTQGRSGLPGSSNVGRGYGFDPHEVVERFWLINCVADNNELDGFIFDGVITFSAVGCLSYNNARHAFNCVAESFDGQFVNCHAYDNDTSDDGSDFMLQQDSHNITIVGCRSQRSVEQGIRLRRGPTIVSTNFIVADNYIEGAGRNGIQCTGCTDNIITGNLFINNGQSADDTYFDISIDEDSEGPSVAERNIVQNNYALANAANRTKAAYRENDAAVTRPTRNIFRNNEAFGHRDTKYLRISPDSVISDRGIFDSFNVKDHGAVGDGTTDDGPALRKLVDFVEERGGGEIFFPPGQYFASGTGIASQGVIQLPDGVTVKGSGPTVTALITQDPGAVGLTGVIRNRNGEDHNDMRITDIALSIEPIAGTSGPCSPCFISADCKRFTLRNVQFTGGQNGTGTAGHGLQVQTDNTNVGSVIENCIFLNNERDGCFLDGAFGIHLVAPYFASNGRHNLAISNAASAIHVSDQLNLLATVNNIFVSDDSEFLHFNGGEVRLAGEDGARIRRGATVFDCNISFKDVNFVLNSRDGISLAGVKNTTFHGCRFIRNNTEGTGGRADISLELDVTHTATKCDHTLVSNCVFEATLPNVADHAINEQVNAATASRYFWNKFDGPYSGAVVEIDTGGESTSIRRDESVIAVAGSDTQFQFNNADALAEATGFTYDTANDRARADNGLLLDQPTTPPDVGATEVLMQSLQRDIMRPAVFTEDNIAPHVMQLSLAEYTHEQFYPNTIQRPPQVHNFWLISEPTRDVTPGASDADALIDRVDRTHTSASWLGQAQRKGFDTTAVAGNASGVFQRNNFLYRGSTNDRGGFLCTWLFGFPSPIPTTPRVFIGLSDNQSQTACALNNPSSLSQIVGVGMDEGDSNLHIFSRGTGTAVKIDLGGNFPYTTNAVYQLVLYAPAKYGTAAPIYWYIKRIDSVFEANGVLDPATDDMPATFSVLGMHAGVHNGSTAESIGIDIISMRWEKPLRD